MTRTGWFAAIGLSGALVLLSTREARADRDVVRSGFSVTGRMSYDTYLLGKIGKASITDVFTGGPATELDAGVILDSGLSLFAGWQRAFLGTGPKSPYAKLPTVSSRDDLFAGGLRYLSTNTVGIAFQLDMGYNILHADGADKSGGSASAEFGGLNWRLGLGLSIRPTKWLVIAPTALVGLTLPLSYGAATRTKSGPATQTGKVQGDPQISLSPGLSVGGEFPF